MKHRQDFVTNSSSSSYVIAVKKEIPGSLGTLVKELMEVELDRTVTNEEELREHYTEQYAYGNYTLDDELRDNDYLRERYNQILKLLSEGHVIHFTELDYDAEVYAKVYKILEKAELAKVIEED